MKNGLILFLSDARGIFIPRDFAKSIHRELVSCVSEEDWQVLEAGPEHDLYWDTWHDVTQNATIKTKDGYIFRLYQDGDLWLYCDELMTEQEKIDFWGSDYD